MAIATRFLVLLLVGCALVSSAHGDVIRIDRDHGAGIHVGGHGFDIQPGWDGIGLGAASLNYYFGATTADVSVAQQQAAYITAMQTWASVVDIVFSPTALANQPATVEFHFGVGGHNDPFAPFGTELAHAYFPGTFGPNPEPFPGPRYFAGDSHFNDAYTYEIGDTPGADGMYDLIYIAIHELGHALGLGHSNNINDVMFPFVNANQTFSGLGPGDIASIRALYSNTGAGRVILTPVPEPTSLALWSLLSVTGIAAVRRRRRS